jgi:adenosylcobinamide kinase / adenosylcobinamide-phosphate guanylyltransferase
MARIILVTGGSRSGKSTYAQNLAEALPGKRAYIATCPVIDDEMQERVRKHQQARKDGNWQTIEEPLELARIMETRQAMDTLLVDCLTLWINNLLYQAEQRRTLITEIDVHNRCEEILHAGRRRKGTVIFVTNEIGMGIVPDNALTRQYRDLAGRCNQTMAAGADTVTLVCCGIPLQLKGNGK